MCLPPSSHVLTAVLHVNPPSSLDTVQAAPLGVDGGTSEQLGRKG